MKCILPALLGILLVSSCEKTTDAAASIKDSAAKIDTSKLTPEAMQAEANKLVGTIKTKLGEISDHASAIDVSKQLDPIVSQLKGLKDKLGLDKLDLSSIKTAISDLSAKFGADPKIMEAIQPLIDKLEALLK